MLKNKLKESKEERNMLYRLARYYYINSNYGVVGICSALMRAYCNIYVIDYDNIFRRPSENRLLDLCPEVRKYNTHKNSMYWFNINDRDSRINIFNSAIKETN